MKPQQVAAIPVRNGKICLVTNLGGRRWMIPKGHVPTGANPAVSAACEAWEEAGVLGHISDAACCAYQFHKSGRDFRVEVFLLEVVRCVGEWPERRMRKRCWLPVLDAIEIVQPGELRDALRHLVEQGIVARPKRRSRAA